MISTIVRHWNLFFFRSTPPHLIALVRIVFGVFLMLYWITQWAAAPKFSLDYGISFPMLKTAFPPLFLILHPTLAMLHVFFLAGFILMISFTVGYRTRTSSGLLLVCLLYYYVVSLFWFHTSYYRLFEFSLSVFLLPGADRTFSVAMMRERGSFFAWEPITILQQRLFSLQMTFTYFAVGIQKTWLPDWQNDMILRYGFTGRWGTPLGFWLARVLPVDAYRWMLLAVKAFECTLPLGLWIKSFRWFYFLGGFVFHTFITLTLGIWWFQFLVPLYIVFIDP